MSPLAPLDLEAPFQPHVTVEDASDEEYVPHVEGAAPARLMPPYFAKEHDVFPV